MMPAGGCPLLGLRGAGTSGELLRRSAADCGRALGGELSLLLGREGLCSRLLLGARRRVWPMYCSCPGRSRPESESWAEAEAA
jgi:hypothetical protein